MKSACFVLHTDLFKPWPVVRAVKEIDILRKNGYEIHAVCWIKSTNGQPNFEKKNGVQLHRVFEDPPKGAVKRFTTYNKVLSRIASKIVQVNPKVIICHDLEILKAGVIAKEKLNVPLFFDAHENWPEMVAHNSRLEARYFTSLEKKLLKKVTHSYTYGNDLTDKYYEMGFSATTLYNSKSISKIPKVEEHEISNMKQELGFEEEDFIVGFSGSVSLTNGTQQVIDSLKDLDPTVKFLVVGGSGRESDLRSVKRYVKIKQLESRVTFTGRVPSETLLRYTAVMDVGTALFQPLSENEKARIPNKIFDYMAMSVPMIVSDFPNMRTIVAEESDCGVCVNPMDVKAIGGAITQFEEEPEMAKKKGENGKWMFMSKYSWDQQVEKLRASHKIWRDRA
jgi:glycosyltransferase involved in cell wall biosynthesis